VNHVLTSPPVEVYRSRLVERLGYRTLAEAQVWVRGVTHQA